MTSQPPSVVSVDIGQTGMRLSGHDGRVRRIDIGGTAVVDDVGTRTMATTLSAHIGSLRPGATVAVGMSGFSAGSPFPGRLAKRIADGTGAHRVILASDTVTSYLGLIGLRPGAVAICGTGSVALGWDGAAWQRADGRGFALGDAGGGSWIGRHGLRSALDALDGRGGSAALAAASSRLGTPEEIYRAAYAAPSPASYLAGFARDVLEIAETGDGAASDIVEGAAAEVSRTVRAVSPPDGVIGLTGGLLRSDLFRSRVLAHIGDPVVLVDPDAALAGARRLAHDAELVAGAFDELVHLIDGSTTRRTPA